MTRSGPPEAFVAELVDQLGSALGHELVAVYLYGSAAAGGFDEGVSDIDLLVVTERELDRVTVDALNGFHRATIRRHPAWSDRLELVYVARDALAAFRAGGNLGVISPGEPFHVRAGVEQWLQNFYLVRETGITLLGPGPQATIPPISSDEFLAAVRQYAAELRARSLKDATPAARAYFVLTMCRAVRTLETGRPCSKREGASWIRARMPEWSSLLDAAEQCRLSGGRFGFADPDTVRAAAELIDRLAVAAAG